MTPMNAAHFAAQNHLRGASEANQIRPFTCGVVGADSWFPSREGAGSSRRPPWPHLMSRPLSLFASTNR